MEINRNRSDAAPRASRSFVFPLTFTFRLLRRTQSRNELTPRNFAFALTGVAAAEEPLGLGASGGSTSSNPGRVFDQSYVDTSDPRGSPPRTTDNRMSDLAASISSHVPRRNARPPSKTSRCARVIRNVTESPTGYGYSSRDAAAASHRAVARCAVASKGGGGNAHRRTPPSAPPPRRASTATTFSFSSSSASAVVSANAFAHAPPSPPPPFPRAADDASSLAPSSSSSSVAASDDTARFEDDSHAPTR